MPGGGCRAVVAASSATAANRRKKAAANRAKAEQPSARKHLVEEEDSAAPASDEPEEPAKKKPFVRRCVGKVFEFLDQTWLQSIQYLLFLYTFQSLTNTMRIPEEFYLDKYVSDTFIDNTFDSAHNTLADIRRASDVWEWTNTVLIPGLMSNADAGEWWPDGDGSFHLDGATPLSTSDIIGQMNKFDFTPGVVFKQVRAKVQEGRECYADHYCLDDAAGSSNSGNTSTFGYGAAHDHFTFWTEEELGSSPLGMQSACPISLRTWSSAGFVAIFQPFFSSELLPDQAGSKDEVVDYRLTEARLGNGVEPKYWCARYTTNGYNITQRCDPQPEANTMVVRQMFVEMVDFLKKGHWIDTQTRMVSVSLQVRNNNRGVLYLIRFMFELTQMASVLPSFDTEVMVDNAALLEEMELYMFMAVVLTGWFIFLEVVEVSGSGVADYFSNIWNVLDWANFILFFQVYRCGLDSVSLNERDAARRELGADCGSPLCNDFGFMDLWEVMNTARQAKFFMSICVCIQLLKIIKFTNVIVPKMSLMTSVLSKGCSCLGRSVPHFGCYDLLFFGIIFGLSMFAFCMLFYIQLGAFMDDFYTQPSSMIALAKSLFGDFPFEEIMDNSRGYTNGILFLVYLFVAVFILLSMFLAILGEAQAAVREAEQEAREDGTAPNPYGFLGEGKAWVARRLAKLKARARRGKGGEEAEGDGEVEGEEGEGEEESAFQLAVKTRLTKLQAKLDSSLKQRVTSLEMRLLKHLDKMETKLDEPPERRGSVARTPAAKPSDKGGGSGDKKRREAQGKESSESNARRDGLAKSKERPPRPNLTVSPRHSPVAEQVKVH